MKRKVGTALDSNLYRRVQDLARRQGRRTNAIIEEALTRFLARDGSGASVVEETKGTYNVTRKALRALLNESPYGPQ